MFCNDQLCRSWEGAQPGSQPKLANGHIPYHRRHAQFMNRSWPGGWGWGQEFREIRELCKCCEFPNHCLGTGCAIGCQAVRKIVLCIACFAYLLLLLLLLFSLLSY